MTPDESRLETLRIYERDRRRAHRRVKPIQREIRKLTAEIIKRELLGRHVKKSQPDLFGAST